MKYEISFFLISYFTKCQHALREYKLRLASPPPQSHTMRSVKSALGLTRKKRPPHPAAPPPALAPAVARLSHFPLTNESPGSTSPLSPPSHRSEVTATYARANEYPGHYPTDLAPSGHGPTSFALDSRTSPGSIGLRPHHAVASNSALKATVEAAQWVAALTGVAAPRELSTHAMHSLESEQGRRDRDLEVSASLHQWLGDGRLLCEVANALGASPPLPLPNASPRPFATDALRKAQNFDVVGRYLHACRSFGEARHDLQARPSA